MRQENNANIFLKISTLLILTVLCFTAGCLDCNSNLREKYERTVFLSESFKPGNLLEAKAHNGSITAGGAEIAQCNITAVITGKANTIEEAESVANRIEIELQRLGNDLKTVINKPVDINDNSYCVKYDIEIPSKTNMKFASNNGSIRTANICGFLEASTVNGSITSDNIDGSLTLTTVNGSIKCKEVTGNVKLNTCNGSITADYTTDSGAINNIEMTTTNGSVTLTAPADLSAKAEISTVNGKISSRIPITVIGDIGSRNINGTIGSGEGVFRIRTVNGSITIK